MVQSVVRQKPRKTFMTYSEKLRDPRWQKKRLLILQRDDWTCLFCGSKDKNLQVHHTIYQRREPWDYPDQYYQTLCEDCHEIRQELTDKAVTALRITIKDVPTERLERVSQKVIAEAMATL